MPGDTSNANAAKTAAASARDAADARAALDKLGETGVPSGWRDVAQARIEHTGDTWQQTADRLGVTKFQASSAFRRLLVAAGIREPDRRRGADEPQQT